MTFVLLGVSILLSVGRNLCSKKLSDLPFGCKTFFLCQGILFLCGGIALALFGGIAWEPIAPMTWCFAALYALLLIAAQWFYTAALAGGNTALCSTVYSMGFTLPTLSGALLWSEVLSPLDWLGILCAASAVALSGFTSHTKKHTTDRSRLLPLVIAMVASGGLGIVQKMQQRSAVAEQTSAFLLIAFLLAAAISLTVACLTRKHTVVSDLPKRSLTAAVVGLFFGCCNRLNTSLSGRLDSAIFFPTLNIGVILLSMVCGIVFFKEKLTKKEIAVLLCGSLSILLLTLG